MHSVAEMFSYAKNEMNALQSGMALLPGLWIVQAIYYACSICELSHLLRAIEDSHLRHFIMPSHGNCDTMRLTNEKTSMAKIMHVRTLCHNLYA